MSALQSLVENWQLIVAIVLGVGAFIALRQKETVVALILGAIALALVGVRVSWGAWIAIALVVFFLTWVMGGRSVLGWLGAVLALIVALRLGVPSSAWAGKKGIQEADAILGGAEVSFDAPGISSLGGVVSPSAGGGWTWGEQVPQVTPEVRVECQVADGSLGKWFSGVPLRPVEWNAGMAVAPEGSFCEVGQCENCTWRQPTAENWSLKCMHPEGGQWTGTVNGVLARAIGGKPNTSVQFIGSGEWPQSLLICQTIESESQQPPVDEPPPTPTPPPQQEGQQGQTCLTLETATARTGPSSDYQKLADVPAGMSVVVVQCVPDPKGFVYGGSSERCHLQTPDVWVHCGTLRCSP